MTRHKAVVLYWFYCAVTWIVMGLGWWYGIVAVTDIPGSIMAGLTPIVFTISIIVGSIARDWPE